MKVARAAYNLLAPLGATGARAAALFIPKMGEAVAGRRGWKQRWGALSRTMDARPVWFHVASVGEFEQARPVITALERDHPGVPVMVTFSSPSGYHFARKRETPGNGAIQFIDYLPFDLRNNMRRCVAAANPRVLVTVKFDLWPNLVWEAHARAVPIVLIDATLSPSSARLRFPARWVYRDVYACISRILAISAEDAARFAAAVPSHTGIAVTGDTRFDRVMERWNRRAATPVDIPDDDTPTVIAGSTWPADEAHLLPALTRLLRARERPRVVVVPHEPTALHVAPLLRWAETTGEPLCVTSKGNGTRGARIIVMDVVGVLAEAYRHAQVAFVGGAFSTGVHSVIEPAIAGIPVVFGPHHDNSFEASQLVARGAAVCARSADEIHAALSGWLADDDARRRAGAAARAYVESQIGATEKCMAVIATCL